jgi:EAL domain-containing protein (putative c-di-GMP-specific phosphodiesterase class I)
MEKMGRSCISRAKKVIQWGKILLPLSSIRYYPPQFTLRNPVLEGVTAAFKNGRDAAVIVFNIKNMNDLASELSAFQLAQLIKSLKKYLRLHIEQSLDNQKVITLQDFKGTGISLFLMVDDQHCMTEIEMFMKNVLVELENKLHQLYPDAGIILETGYMFVEKNYYSIEDAIYLAHRQAAAMAEKKVRSDYNEMFSDIKKLIAQKDILLLAQPIIDVATKEIHAWELLTRGPEGTILEAPPQLFSIARQTGMLYELELMVIEKAFQQIQAARFRQDIFLNFTPITLGDMRITRDIKRLLEKYKGISPERIVLEVTERESIEGLKHFNYNIKILRLMGFRIAVDDTGAGYASLNTISQLMPDIIKIDRSVIEDIDKNSVKESMLKGLLLVAKEAGSLVVAEGIENADEASVMTRNKVDLVQGYFYARPTALIAT